MPGRETIQFMNAPLLKVSTTPMMSVTSARQVSMQRKCACGGTPGPTGECEACRRKRLQRKAEASELGSRNASLVPPVVYEALRSPGQPLDPATRAFMEPSFGRDFSGVRVHTDAKAAESAQAVNALAYTVGQDVIFGADQYAPETAPGRRLLAHELAHTAQQAGRGPSLSQANVLEIADPSDPFEREAEAVASQVMTEGTVVAIQWKGDSGTKLQRQPKPTAPTPALPGSPSCTPRTGVTEYGCYCGAGSSCPGGLNCTPANELDACCQQHDIDYAGCGFLDRFNPFGRCCEITAAADAKFCECARGLAGRFHGASEAYRLGVLALFCWHPPCSRDSAGSTPATPANPSPPTPQAGPLTAPAPAPPAAPGAPVPACARPVNWRHFNPTDHGDNAIRVSISWDSSTGNLADLGNCTVREVVRYDPIPDPPFHWNPPNPTILTVPGVNGAAMDTHSYPPGLRHGISNPRQAGIATAHQTYQYQCTGPGCTGNWTDFPGETYDITREVFPQYVRPNPWRYRITKAGVGNPFNYSREVEIPEP